MDTIESIDVEEKSMKTYEELELEIIVFENVDVIDDSFDNDAEAPHIPGKNFF